MATEQYQLPCSECDQSISVSARQAGQEVSCTHCSAVSQAPRLGEMKKLPLVETAAVNKTRKPTQGNQLFALGLLTLALFGVMGGGLLYYANSIIVEYDVEGALEETDPMIDELPPSQVVFLFQQMDVKKGLPQWEEQPHVAATKQGNILKYFSYALFGIGAIGGLTMISGLLSSAKK